MSIVVLAQIMNGNKTFISHRLLERSLISGRVLMSLIYTQRSVPMPMVSLSFLEMKASLLTFFWTIDDLRGSIYFASLPYLYAPSAAPTQQPAGINSIQASNVIGNLSAGVVAAIFLAGFVGLGLIALILYCCCCRAAPLILDKKKKKEEEDSPYQVHSYMGYSEMDEPPAPPRPPSMYPFLPQFLQPTPPPMEMKDLKKDDLKKDIDKADPGFVRRMFPYKVYSYRGYREGDEHARREAEDAEDADQYVGKEKADYYQDSLPEPPMQRLNSETLSYSAESQMRPRSQLTEVDMSAMREELRRHDEANASHYFREKFVRNNPTLHEGEEGEEDEEEEDAVAEGRVKGKGEPVGKEREDDQEEMHIKDIHINGLDEQTVSTITTGTHIASVQNRYAKYLAAAKASSTTRENATKPPAISPRRSPSQLHTPSIELDVAMTEPMKALALQEVKDKTMRSDSMDPEARNDLAQQDEVNRLRAVEAIRNQEEYQQQQLHRSEEFLRASEMNRLKEEEKLRNEEKIRARFAFFKNKAAGENPAEK